MRVASSVEVGRRAEQAGAEYLSKVGYRVVERNFMVPKICEIDIIATKDAQLYFVEVKYRRNLVGGGGMDYITPEKLAHMRRAAAIWVRNNRYNGGYTIAAIEVTGPDMAVTNFIDSIY